jgi:hypothetical protein
VWVFVGWLPAVPTFIAVWRIVFRNIYGSGMPK